MSVKNKKYDNFPSSSVSVEMHAGVWLENRYVIAWLSLYMHSHTGAWDERKREVKE